MKYKVLASDLDGTLLDSKAQLSVENKFAIQQINKIGVFFVPSSGRTLYEIPEEVRCNENVRFIIYADGAVVIDKKTGKKLKAGIDASLASFAFDILGDYDVLMSVRTNDRGYINADKNSVEDHEYYNIGKLGSEFIHKMCIPTKDHEIFCRSLEEIDMLGIYFRCHEELVECCERMKERPELVCVPINEYYLEIHHKDAGKGEALRRLSEYLGIACEHIIAVGDSTNDIGMIKAAGLGLAMGNAADELVEVADAKICGNDEHAIKYILENYICD